AQGCGDMRREVAVTDELFGIHRRRDDRVRPLEPRVAQGGVRGLGHEVGERLTAAADPRYPRAGDPHLTHRASACPAGSGPVNPYMRGRTVARRRTAPQGAVEAPVMSYTSCRRRVGGGGAATPSSRMSRRR